MLANARRANAKLTRAPWPAEGKLQIVTAVEEAVDGAYFVQESAPERLELKQQLFATASRVAGADVVFGSSTSGLLPTEMQREMAHPERLVVGHPFNPVYLMPLVEVCGGAQTSETTKQQAAETYRSVGMQPLILSKEIDGFVADRLMEALWREALWLVNDGVATAAEIDDAMRFGPGLRWSFMGTFLIYRIAGGEAGMRHFMAQFGPALKWPWTKLMDVPELTDELLDRICAQSDDQVDLQTPGLSIRELEALRDDCLVEVMHGLRNRGFAAGKTLADFEQSLFDRGNLVSPDIDLSVPIQIHERDVPAVVGVPVVVDPIRRDDAIVNLDWYRQVDVGGDEVATIEERLLEICERLACGEASVAQAVHHLDQAVVAERLELADRQPWRLQVDLIVALRADPVEQLVGELGDVHQLRPRPLQCRPELSHEMAHSGFAPGNAVDQERAHEAPAQPGPKRIASSISAAVATPSLTSHRASRHSASISRSATNPSISFERISGCIPTLRYISAACCLVVSDVWAPPQTSTSGMR